MRRLGIVMPRTATSILVALLGGAVWPACAGGAAKGSGGPIVDPPPPPAPRGDLPEAPIAGPQVCPAGTESLVEEQTLGELRSCVIRAKGGSTPYRHGPYELIGAGGKLLMLGEWRDNQYEGVWRWWHPNGKLRRETSYRNGAAVADANWDDAGRPIDQRDGQGVTMWYPNGNKQSEQRAVADGVMEARTWFENGKPAKEIRQLNGRWDGVQSEWFENGQKKEEGKYHAGKLVTWQGWSSTGRELTDDTCVEDADCVGGIHPGECWACVPPYEAITRWRQAQRTMRPPPEPKGCDPGPFGCAGLPQPPAAACKSGRCAFGR